MSNNASGRMGRNPFEKKTPVTQAQQQAEPTAIASPASAPVTPLERALEFALVEAPAELFMLGLKMAVKLKIIG